MLLPVLGSFSVTEVRGQDPGAEDQTFHSPDGTEISPAQHPKPCSASSTRTSWSLQAAQSWGAGMMQASAVRRPFLGRTPPTTARAPSPAPLRLVLEG